jgi:glyoxylate utilization-related uncharacterized protein
LLQPRSLALCLEGSDRRVRCQPSQSVPFGDPFLGRNLIFFFVLEGELTLEVEHHHFVLQAGEGIEVSPGQQHQALNKSESAIRMMVTSQPPSHGDRINA